jgi:hypothetical protein
MDYAEQMVAIAEQKVDAVICSFGLFFADDMAALTGSLFGLVRHGVGRPGAAVFGDHVFDPMRQVFVETVHELAPVSMSSNHGDEPRTLPS